MTESSKELTLESLLELLEQERRYYEVLRNLAREERGAMARGDLQSLESLLKQQEQHLLRAQETTSQRGEALKTQRERVTGKIEQAVHQAEKEMRLFALENAQTMRLASRRLEDINLTLSAVAPSGGPRPSYTASGETGAGRDKAATLNRIA